MATSSKQNVSDYAIIDKIINNNPDTYVIFFKKTCPYCVNALNKLRQSHVKYKGYDINAIDGDVQRLLELFIKHKDQIKFDPNHKTIPIIFYNGVFIGGQDKLFQHIDSKMIPI